MKLLLLTPATCIGGAEEHLLAIGSAAQALGWDVHAASAKVNESLTVTIANAGIKHYRLEIAHVYCPSVWLGIVVMLREAAHVLSLLLRLKPDLVHVSIPCFDFSLGTLLACALLGIPAVVVFHLVPPGSRCGYRKRWLYLWAKQRNQRWITVSQDHKQRLCKLFGLSDDDVCVIHNGVKLKDQIVDLKDGLTARQSIRRELGLGEKDYMALTVARLSEWQKDHSTLIQAIPDIVKAFSQVKFVWVGDGDSRGQIEDKVEEYEIEDKVLILGYKQRADVYRLLLAADLFIFPTRFEGLPFAVLEAMAFGVPIIAANAPGIPELIEHEVHGLLYRTGDSGDLSQTVIWALNHPDEIREMAGNAIERAAEEFSESRMIVDTLSAFEKLAGRAQNGR